MTAGVKAGHNGPASSACTLVLLAIALTLTACERQAPPPADDTPDPPNILLIFADDLGYGDVLFCASPVTARLPAWTNWRERVLDSRVSMPPRHTALRRVRRC
jgi:hypothetical protein